MKYTSTCLLLMLMLTINNGYAQTPEEAVENLRNNYTKEGIYIHYDKNSYVAGETIWFKAYVIEGVSPALVSTAISVELMDDSGKVVDSKILPLAASAAAGNLEIPRNSIQSSYTVQAHTRRMINFGNDYFYEQQLPVYNPSSARKAVKPATTPHIYFLPEGGEMIKGISNVIAFKCTDQAGAPLSCSGIVTDSKNKQVATFKSVHDGLGKFSFTPKAGENYTVLYTADDKRLTAILPEIKSQGVSLQIQNSGTDKYFVINSETVNSDALTPAYLLAVMENVVLMKQELPLASKNIRGRLPLEKIPSGILQLTVFNKNNQPISERMLFVNNNDFFVDAELHTDTISKEKRGRNAYSLVINDTMAGTYSISVTDLALDIDVASRENIVSRLLFSNEIKDKINDPMYYFESTDPARNENLDLVMMTSGWRRFTWKQALTNNLPKMSFRDGDYVSFAAKIFKLGTNEPMPNTGVTLLVETEDSYDALKLVTDKDANLIVPGMIFADSARIHFIQHSNPGEKIVSSIYSLPLSKLMTYPSRYFTGDNSSLGDEKNSPEVVMNRFRSASDKGRREFITLENLQVKATRKNEKAERVKSRYQNSPFSSRDQNNNMSPNEYWYYQQNIGFARSGRDYFWSPMSLGGIGSADMLMPNINAQLGFAGSGMGFLGTDMRPVNYYNNRIPGLLESYDNSISLEGFSPVKEFFSPDYSVVPNVDFNDNRSTLYWNPYLNSKKGSQTIPISFYNSDNSKKFRVVVTGMTADGKLLYIQKIIE